MSPKEINSLCDLIRETAFDTHKYLRNGHLEKVYERSLSHRLEKKGVKVVTQHPLPVFDEDGFLLGDFYADLLIEDSILVELKAVREIADEHISQLLGYLNTSRIENGLLINFGAPRLSVKKYIVSRPK